MTDSAKRADTGKDYIGLTAEQASKFDLAMQRRVAIMEAGETMARNFATQMDEAMQALTQAYQEVAEAEGFDLTTHRYEYDPKNKRLVLTQVSLHGTLR
jgi:hypothetical protein